MTKDELALWLKGKEIKAIDISRESDERGTKTYQQGKAAGFSEVWEYVVSDGKNLSPNEYNLANEYWSNKYMEAEKC